MRVTLAAYKVLMSLARVVSPLESHGSSKLARGVAGRRSAHEKLARWGKEQRDAGPDCETEQKAPEPAIGTLYNHDGLITMVTHTFPFSTIVHRANIVG